MFVNRRIQAIAIIAIVGLGLLPVTLRAQKDGKTKQPKPIPLAIANRHYVARLVSRFRRRIDETGFVTRSISQR